MPKTFVVLYTPGTAWLPDKPVWEQPLRAHGEYMKQLYDTGKMTQGGPYTDNGGGLTILSVEDEAEAQQIIEKDPAVVHGIMNAELHPWYSVNWDTFGTT
jgi:uncharacterized protein